MSSPVSISLWLRNKADAKYEITFDELLDKFVASPLYTKPTNRWFEFTLMDFINAPEGLDSVNDPADFAAWNNLVARAMQRGIVSQWRQGQVR